MNTNKKILVIDDEESMRKNVNDLLTSEMYSVIEASDGTEGIDVFKKHLPDLVILDFNLPGIDGIEILKELKIISPDIPVILFTAFGTNERVIEAMKNGAYDYIEKPFDLDVFLKIVKHALNYSSLMKESSRPNTQSAKDIFPAASDSIIGKNQKMQEIFKLIGKIATSNAGVLIQGESGTGKELIADALQKHSLRNKQPYIKLNCGALTETLLESEIFGHEKGAFTGALNQKAGVFELANNGTIFLDEVNTMSLALQVKLLRVLQNQNFFRVGGETPINIDVRIIAATNVELAKEVEKGCFRKDLFYRLNIININVPPLRMRLDDLNLLVEHFLKKYDPARKLIITPDILEKFKLYSWPGNVRELENTIQSFVVTSKENITFYKPPLSLSGQPQRTLSPEERLAAGGTLKSIIEDVEKQLILKALEMSGGNRSQAAKILDINRRQLYTKMNEFGIL